VNGVAFGLTYEAASRRTALDRRRLALGMALAEHVALYPLAYFVDRYHPARGKPGVPPLLRSPRAFVQAAWRHAIFGVALEGTSGSRLNSLYGFPRMRDLLSDVLRVRAVKKVLGKSYSPAPVVGELGEPSRSVWIVGAGLAMRRSDWLRAGGLDEGYFLWYEDIDLGARVTGSGGACTVVREVVVRHHGAMSWVRLTRRRRQVLRLRAAHRYASQHMSRGAAALILACGPFGYLIGVALDVIHWPLDIGLRRSGTPKSAG